VKIIDILAARIDKLWSLAKPITSARPIHAMCVFAASLAVSLTVVLAGATASAQPASGTEKAELLRPKVLSDTRVDYPAGARGDAEVVLELVIGEDGSVEEVRAKRGDDPFVSVSIHAAKQWRFEPARRAGKPMRARILMQVLFTEPEPEPEPVPEPEPEPVPEPDSGRGSPSTSTSTSRIQPEPRRGPTAEPEPVDVVVRGERSDASKRMTRAEVRELPGAFGDPFRAIEILPGVTPVASGLPYFFVRGAPPGNVGYFFDGIPVPGLYHVAAGPAVIHPAFVRDVRLYSGAFPASYGRFAGAVVASSAAPPENRFRGEANLRLVDTGLMIESPFAGGRGNVMAAGRYSHTGAIVSLLVPEVEVGYWDYQHRIQYRVSDRDTLTVFGFGAYDFLSAEDDDGEMQDLYDVTFHRLDLRYDRRLAPGSALRLSTTLGLDRASAGDRVDLTARSVRNRVLYTRRLSPKVLLRTGGDVQTAQYDIDLDRDDQDGPDEPGEPEEFEMLPLPGLPPRPPTRRDTDALVEARFASRTDLVTGAWLDFVLGVGGGVTLTPGFRFDVYASDGTVRLAPEPRLSARFELSDRVALLHDIGLAHQPPSFAIPVPGLQGSSAEGLQRGVQSSAGTEVLLGHNLAGSFTVFQSFVWGATDPLSLIQLQRADTQVSARADRVTSHTYGLELMLRRSLTERLGGFASYTLSRSMRSTGRLRGPSSFDRTHVFNAAVAYDLGRAWRAGLRTAVYSGTPAELAYVAAVSAPPRTPTFYRLDWRLEKRWPLGEDGFWALVLEVLNTTLHKETLELSCYAYGCTKEEIGPVTIPSIGLEASF
jgi:hypothetical protein